MTACFEGDSCIRRTVVEYHGDGFLEVVIEFLKRLTLAMRAGKAGNVTDVKSCIRATFENGRVTSGA